MPNYRLVAPYIRWGVNLANAIYFPFPSDTVFSGSEPRPGSEFIQLPSGNEAGWRVGTDYVWAGTQRWIAQADTLFYPRCTGWDGALGVRVALESLQNRQTFSWHPDGRNLLRLPLLTANSGVTLAAFPSASTYASWTGFADAGTTGVTIAFDAGQGAWKLIGTNPTGGPLAVTLAQFFPAIVGEQFIGSADVMCSGLAGGADARLIIQAYDSSPAFISQPMSDVIATNTGSFVRIASAQTSVFPANTAYLLAILKLRLPGGVGATGTVWFRKGMVRRDSSDTTFIDNPSVDGVYFVEPTQLSPANESDGSRQLVMRIRTPSAPFDGY